MVIDIGDIGGDIADWDREIVINRDIILDLIVDILVDRVGDIPQATEFIDVKIESLGKRKGLAPSSKELTALRKAVVDRVKKGR